MPEKALNDPVRNSQILGIDSLRTFTRPSIRNDSQYPVLETASLLEEIHQRIHQISKQPADEKRQKNTAKPLQQQYYADYQNDDDTPLYETVKRYCLVPAVLYAHNKFR